MYLSPLIFKLIFLNLPIILVKYPSMLRAAKNPRSLDYSCVYMYAGQMHIHAGSIGSLLANTVHVY